MPTMTLTKEKLLTIVCFALIWIFYFSSAAGLYNSMDTPQWFTLKAIKEHASLDITPYGSDPHYYIKPDFLEIEGRRYALRGYLNSLFSIPLYWAAQGFVPYVTTAGFPDRATDSPNFALELTFSGFYSLFTVLGLFFAFRSLLLLTKHFYLSLLLTFVLALGTPFWKYSSVFARHSLSVFVLGVLSYIFILNASKAQTPKHVSILAILLACTYGIDPIDFLSLTIGIFLHLAIAHGNVLEVLSRKYSVAFLLFLAIIVTQIVINLIVFGSPLSSQVHNWNFLVDQLAAKEMTAALFSGPIFPSLTWILFGFSALPEEVFINFKTLPDSISHALGVPWANQWTFYGIFVNTPTLLPAIFAPVFVLSTRQQWRSVVWPLFVIVAVSTVLYCKKLDFWGGNQFDIRYYYPLMLPLCILSGFVTSTLLSQSSSLGRLVIWSGLTITVIFSLFMGWLGILNMYGPSLTGTRRIHINLNNFWLVFQRTSASELVQSTFYNLQNAWIAFFAIAVAVLVYLSYRYLSHKIISVPTSPVVDDL